MSEGWKDALRLVVIIFGGTILLALWLKMGGWLAEWATQGWK